MDNLHLGLLRHACGKSEIKLNKSSMPNKTLIVLPAFNVSSVVRNVATLLPRSQTIFVDDGSTDGTYEIIKSLGFKIIKHPRNLGLSAAIVTGEQYAIQHGYTHTLFMDSDGQHPPEIYNKFISKLKTTDFVVGDRFSKLDNIPPQKISSNLFASLLVKKVTGTFIRDVSCGYRGYKLTNTTTVSRFSGYSQIYAQIVEAAMSGVVPVRVSIPAIYDLSQPIATKISEIYGLCNALSIFSPQLSLLSDITNCLDENVDFQVRIEGVNFSAHYVDSCASYVFSTDQAIAVKLYAN